MTTFWLLCWVPQSSQWELRLSCLADCTDDAIAEFAKRMPNTLKMTHAWAVTREDNLKYAIGRFVGLTYTPGQFVGEVVGKGGAT